MQPNDYYEEKKRDEKIREANKGLELFFSIIKKKNEKSEGYYYECLSTIDEYSNYDVQIQKHPIEDWGDVEISYHEIKVRGDNYSFTTYTDSCIDQFKIRQLQKIAYMSGKDVFVNMFYPADRTLLIWKIDPEIEYPTKKMTNVTWKSATIATNEIVKIPCKDFVLLNNDDAVKIRY